MNGSESNSSSDENIIGEFRYGDKDERRNQGISIETIRDWFPKRTKGESMMMTPPGRYTTTSGSQTLTTSPEMEGNGSLGGKGGEGGFEITVHREGTGVEGNDNTVGRVTSGQDGTSGVYRERSVRTGNGERIHSKAVRRSTRGEIPTDSRLSSAKQVPKPTALQDGRPKDAGGNSATWGLSGQDRFEGCLSACTDPQGPSEIPTGMRGRGSLSVQSTSVWLERCSASIYKDLEGSATPPPRTVDKDSRLFRRHIRGDQLRSISKGKGVQVMTHLQDIGFMITDELHP